MKIDMYCVECGKLIPRIKNERESAYRKTMTCRKLVDGSYSACTKKRRSAHSKKYNESVKALFPHTPKPSPVIDAIHDREAEEEKLRLIKETGEMATKRCNTPLHVSYGSDARFNWLFA